MGNRFYSGVLLIVLSFGLCGCVTQRLWEDKAFDGFNQPARPPNLQVSRCDGDWLVQYDEVNENSVRIRRRTYFLYANDERVRQHKKPHFEKGTIDTSGEVRAVFSDTAPEFTLYDGDKLVGTYELPVYPKPSGRVKQVILTPFALVADAGIGVAGVAVFAAYLWLQSGAPLPN